MSSSGTEQLVDVLMPAMGTSITEGTVTGWIKQVGDVVQRDEPICEIASDKTDTECPAPVSGVLREILVEPGETVQVGTALARIASHDAGSTNSSSTNGSGPELVSAAAPEPAPSSDQATGGSPSANGAMARVPQNGDRRQMRATPVVRRMVIQHGLDLSLIGGSGHNGRVTKQDVEAYLQSASNGHADAEPPLHSESPYRPDPTPAAVGTPTPPSVPPGSGPAAVDGASTGRPVQLSRMRRSIGRAMRNSLATAATCTTVVECDMSAIERARSELGVTALPIVAEKVVQTLREFASLNANLDDETLTVFDDVHLGIAVSLGDDGLVVPVIRSAQHLSTEGLAQAIRKLARAARDKQLGPDDFAGASFTITSPGAFGALMATPVINVPQVGILDMEAITRRPVVITDSQGNESIAIRSMTYFCLSWDHRAIDGVYAARFLTALRSRIEAGA